MRPVRRFVFLALGLSLAASEASAEPAFTVTSDAFKDGGTLGRAQVNGKWGCGWGGDRSPALAWTDPPAGAKGFAVSSFDPDARKGAGWWHWVVFDLPPATASLPEGAGRPGRAPEGARDGTNSFGTLGYGGACPPSGEPPHHYVFTVWALGVAKAPFDAGAADDTIGAWLAANALGKAVITARYGR